MFTQDYSGSINQLKIAQHNLELCGMSGGALDNVISGCQAEIHLQKSEYAEARHIYRRVLVTALAELNPAPCAFALLNIAKVDSIIGGSQEEVLKNLEKAKAVFTNLQYPFGMTACDMILAKLKLREGKFTSANTLTESLNSCWGKATQSTLYSIFLVYTYKSQKQLALHKALLFLGGMFSCNTDWDTASNLYTVGLTGFTHMDVHHGWARDVVQIDKKLAEVVVAVVSIPKPEILEVENRWM
ncbi:hypothetical protein B0H14DRAFT_2596892 [Mycena olivaceomarginata]|nr:hypothetical protein B0H14DRAFT_2596892 [Mycena olivaceomarginata]